MDWTPDEIKKLVKKFGGVAVMAEIMRVKPHSIQNMIYGSTGPAQGSGIAILNLIEILEETMSQDELARVLEKLRQKNKEFSKARIRRIKPSC